MKKYYAVLLVALILVSTLAAGCGVSKAEYDDVKAELETVKKVYPLREFASLNDLKAWLAVNEVSKEKAATTGPELYARALKIQEAAMLDGYMISADYDYLKATNSYLVYCVAVIGGRVYYWNPETDEVTEDTTIGTVK